MAKWKKVAGGKHYPRRGGLPDVVRTGDVVECEGWQLGNAISQYERIDLPDPLKLDLAPDELEIRSRGGGWFDVVDKATGSLVNEQSLRRPEAEEFVRDRTQRPSSGPAPTEDPKADQSAADEGPEPALDHDDE